MSDERTDIQPGSDAEFAALDLKTTEGSSNRVAWLAVLLSVIALIAALYSAFETWTSGDESSAEQSLASIESLGRRVDRSGTALEELESRIGQITHPHYSDDIAAVRQDVEEHSRQEHAALNGQQPRGGGGQSQGQHRREPQIEHPGLQAKDESRVGANGGSHLREILQQVVVRLVAVGRSLG